MHKYRLVAKKGEGTFSEVLKAQCIKNGKYVAIKCMKNHFDSLDQVNNLREIQALRRLSPHPNIIKLLEVLYDQPTGRLALVFELMDMNIYELIRGRRHYVAEERIKSYMYQLIKSMDHMHRNGIFHRDIKPENILIMDDTLKLADFGSCRGIYSKQPYTEYISTRWYRAPECLLTDGYYNYKMDMWGVGCVFFEIVSLFPLFPGTNELDQIQKIHNVVGTPPAELLAKMKRRSHHMDFNFPPKEGSGIEKLIPHVSPECIDLINRLLKYNPDDRLSARQALRHPYFRELRDAEKRQAALISPDLSTSNQLKPPATGDSNTSSSSTHRRSAANARAEAAAAALPSIGGVGKHKDIHHVEHSDKENDDELRSHHSYHATSHSHATHTHSSLPSIGGGGGGDSELPPIGGKSSLMAMGRSKAVAASNYHNYSLKNKPGAVGRSSHHSQVGSVPPGHHSSTKHHSSRTHAAAKPVKPPVAAPTSGSTSKYSTNKYRRSNGYK